MDLLLLCSIYYYYHHLVHKKRIMCTILKNYQPMKKRIRKGRNERRKNIKTKRETNRR